MPTERANKKSIFNWSMASGNIIGKQINQKYDYRLPKHLESMNKCRGKNARYNTKAFNYFICWFITGFFDVNGHIT